MLLPFFVCSYAKVQQKEHAHQHIPSPEELVGMFFSLIENKSLATVCLPCVRGITEPLTRLLRKNGINVVSRPHKTLQQEFSSSRFRPPIEFQTNVVYKIPCADCPWSYIGETARCLSTRKKEHIRNVKMCKTGSNISVHASRNNHSIDFNNGRIIDKGNFRIRKTHLGTPLTLMKQTITPSRCLNNTLFF